MVRITIAFILLLLLPVFLSEAEYLKEHKEAQTAQIEVAEPLQSFHLPTHLFDSELEICMSERDSVDQQKRTPLLFESPLRY